MPNTREKPIELLMESETESIPNKDGFYVCHLDRVKAEKYADHLIANGVTVRDNSKDMMERGLENIYWKMYGANKEFGERMSGYNPSAFCAGFELCNSACKRNAYTVAPTAERRMIMADKKVNILGSVWTIKEESVSENSLLENCDGYCDWTVKEIVVEREKNGALGDMETYIRKVLRHEIIHAFLFESGLYESSALADAWAKNEEMVDWIARQGQKIYDAWKEANALDGQRKGDCNEN